MKTIADTTRDEPLREALQRAAQDLNQQRPEPQVSAAVWAALARRQAEAGAAGSATTTPRRPSRPLAWAGGGLALASFAFAAVILATAPPIADERLRLPTSNATAFMPLVNAERWSQLVRETREQGPAWIVPTEIPRESLAAMGLPYDPARAGESVQAELLVQASGDVLAVRFVR
jgi:hypothetical protein